MRIRIALGAVGLAAIAFGLVNLLRATDQSNPIGLASWLVAALVLHDGVLIPIIAAIGYLLTRFVPPRPRRYVQGGLITSGLIAVIALPMIYRRGTGLPGKTLVERNYLASLAIIIGCIVAVLIAHYLISALLSGKRTSWTKVRAPQDQRSNIE